MIFARMIASIAALGALAVSATPAASAAPVGGGAISQLCAATVGLAPGEKHFAACVQSLSRSAASLQADAHPAAAVARDGRGERSYFEVSRAEAWRRDQQACATLGFDPAGAAFQSCVANLRAALARASMPAM